MQRYKKIQARLTLLTTKSIVYNPDEEELIKLLTWITKKNRHSIN